MLDRAGPISKWARNCGVPSISMKQDLCDGRRGGAALQARNRSPVVPPSPRTIHARAQQKLAFSNTCAKVRTPRRRVSGDVAISIHQTTPPGLSRRRIVR